MIVTHHMGFYPVSSRYLESNPFLQHSITTCVLDRRNGAQWRPPEASDRRRRLSGLHWPQGSILCSKPVAASGTFAEKTALQTADRDVSCLGWLQPFASQRALCCCWIVAVLPFHTFVAVVLFVPRLWIILLLYCSVAYCCGATAVRTVILQNIIFRMNNNN